MKSRCLFIFILYLNVIRISGNIITCNCHIIGTMPTIEGESMCDNDKCKCYPNVIGKYCDKCAKGFYDIFSGHGCTNCNCNVLGSHNKFCNTLTGQCSCKDGFVGLRCDQCAPNMYKYSSTKCSDCNCNVYGSKDPQCNVVGQCPCLPNVQGKHCDQCKENTYSIKQGCISCPSCYDFVQSGIKTFTKYLETIEQAIEDIENNLPLYIQEFKHFSNEIKVLKAKINKLRLEYDEATKKDFSEKALQDLSKQAEALHNEIITLIQKMNKEFNNKEIKNALYNGKQELKEANNLIKVCEEALKNATQISNSLNKHNNTMTRTAKQALAKTQEIEEKAEQFHQLSLNVSSTCTETCNIAELFQKNHKAHREEINNINTQVLNASNGLHSIKMFVTGFNKEAKKSRKEALRLQKEANKLDVPVSDSVLENWNKIKDDQSAISNALKILHKSSNEANKTQNSAQNLLVKVQNKQNKIDKQLLIAQEYDKRADDAIAATNNIFDKVQESLNRMQEYDKIKQSAIEALKNMPEIRKKIDNILNNSEEIVNIFEELTDVIRVIEIQKQKTDGLLKIIAGSKIMHRSNLKAFQELVQQQVEIQTKLEEYQSKLTDIKRDLAQAEKDQKEIELYIKRLQEYIIFMNALPLTAHELSQAEKDIEKLEKMRIDEIKNSIDYLRNEKEKLQKEVKNVKDILESLPIDDPTLCETAKSEPKTIRG